VRDDDGYDAEGNARGCYEPGTLMSVSPVADVVFDVLSNEPLAIEVRRQRAVTHALIARGTSLAHVQIGDVGATDALSRYALDVTSLADRQLRGVVELHSLGTMLGADHHPVISFEGTSTAARPARAVEAPACRLNCCGFVYRFVKAAQIAVCLDVASAARHGNRLNVRTRPDKSCAQDFENCYQSVNGIRHSKIVGGHLASVSEFPQ
jgi:hypothetical protein